MSNFILVHGAWHGAWCWTETASLLQRKRASVSAPDLPAHGADTTPVPEVSFADYTERVCDVVDKFSGSSILVGHSTGGVVITQVAEYRPEKLQALVYLSGMLPQNGQTLFDLVRSDRDAMISSSLVMAPDWASITVRREAIRDCFYQMCPEERARAAEALLRPEPLAPLNEQVRTSVSKFGSVQRYFIGCLHDRAVSPALQKSMYSAVPCAKVFMLDTDHSPFFSAPKKLVACLEAIDRESADVFRRRRC